MNSDVNVQSLRNVIEDSGWSWDMVDDHDREFVMKRLRTIEDLDEDQCNELYRKIDDVTSIAVGRELSQWLYRVKKILNDKWIQKCMCNNSTP